MGYKYNFLRLFRTLGDAAAYEGVEEQVSGAEDYNPIALDIADSVSELSL